MSPIGPPIRTFEHILKNSTVSPHYAGVAIVTKALTEGDETSTCYADYSDALDMFEFIASKSAAILGVNTVRAYFEEQLRKRASDLNSTNLNPPSNMSTPTIPFPSDLPHFPPLPGTSLSEREAILAIVNRALREREKALSDEGYAHVAGYMTSALESIQAILQAQ